MESPNKAKATNDYDSVAERAEHQISQIDYNDFLYQVPNTRISQAIMNLPDYERFEITQMLSESYDKSPIQARILKILSLSEKGYALRDCITAQDIANSGDVYFIRCMSQNFQPMLSGLAQWFDITERELVDEINTGGERGKQLERLLQMIRAYADDAALSGEHVPAISRWHDESRWGLHPESKITVSYKQDEDVKQRLAEIAKGLTLFAAVNESLQIESESVIVEYTEEDCDICQDETTEA